MPAGLGAKFQNGMSIKTDVMEENDFDSFQ